MLSSPILNEIGVNQGGICSGMLFRKYMSDLSRYLTSEFGVCIGENVIGHLLRADDLILFSDSITGLQRQLNGLMQFCCFNQMIVNESKTKAIQFGKKNNIELFFNKKKISSWIQILGQCYQVDPIYKRGRVSKQLSVLVW